MTDRIKRQDILDANDYAQDAEAGIKLGNDEISSLKKAYPSNSRTKPVEKEEEPKRVQKVITGAVVQRKKSLGKRFMETFIGDDIKNVKSYILHEVLIPAAKDTISDIVEGITSTIQGSIDVSLFGETRRRPVKGKRQNGSTYVSYNSYSSNKKEDRREVSNTRNRARHQFDDIVFETRAEAEEVAH